MPRRVVPAVVAALLLAVLGAPLLPAVAEPTATGSAFSPTPASKPLYGSQSPDKDPGRQQKTVAGADGVNLFVETWLPAPKDGHVPPAKLPTILIMTPYVSEGVEEYPANAAARIPGFISYMNARGYAVAQHHVRGTGESGGCLEQTAQNQIEDGSRIVEYLGRDAPWTNGNVGMYGISYDAETQISVAGLGDKAKTKYLKAIVPAASVGGQYEYSYFDGVPYVGQAALSNAGYLALVSAPPGKRPAPQSAVQKLTCQPEVLANSGDPSGDMTPFWKVREYRPGADKVTAATLFVHGLRDFNVQPITIAGFFDRLPATTPHKGLFGVWNHAFPQRHQAVEPQWARSDWLPMVTAWYDRYLKGLATGVEQWPAVQVQANDGQWRAEPEFPSTGGPVGQLALGPNGSLGLQQVTGATSYTEAATEEEGRAVFQTGKLSKPLHLTGQPVLDLWITTNRSDGHIAARIDVLDANGKVRRHAGSSSIETLHSTYGFRSLRHLDPMPGNYFQQETSKPPPVGEAIRVPVRFQPTDLRVAAGGSLRVTVAGVIGYTRDSAPSGSFSTITVMHSCGRPSALRFLMPRAGSPLLDVREVDEDGRLGQTPARLGATDGGIATAPVCGRPPLRLASFGPASAEGHPVAAPAGPRPAAPSPRTRPAGALAATGPGIPLPGLALPVLAIAAVLHRRRTA